MDMRKINKICAQMTNQNQLTAEVDGIKIRINPVNAPEIVRGFGG